MEGPGRWRTVKTLLRSCYAELLPLEAFVARLQESAGPGAGSAPEPLLQDGDPRVYRSLVRSCLVARSSACKALPQRPSFQQVSSQNDVVARIIQRICEKKKKNVLAFGFAPTRENSLQPPCMPNISRYLPNYTTETLRRSVLWEIILSRIGDDVMMYILEHCALFLLVPPSCCYQICGHPIYSLASNHAKSPPEFLKRKPRPAQRLLSSFLPGRFHSSKKGLANAKWRRWDRGRQRWSKAEEGLKSSSWKRSTIQRTSGKNFATDKPVTRAVDVLRSHPYQNLPLRPSLKRKAESQYENIPKRMKITEAKENLEQSIGKPDGSKSWLTSGGVGGDASGPGLKDGSPNDQEGLQALALSSKSPCEPSTRTKSQDLGTGISHTAPAIHLPTREPTGTQRTVHKKASSSAWTPSGIQIERRSLLHSHRPLKERLPASFILNRLNRYPAGGWRLVESIFLRSKILKQPGDLGLSARGRGKKRLPKRYWEMRKLFQELLKNHARCPYLHLLKKHCPTWDTKPVKVCCPGGQTHQQRSVSQGQAVNMAGNCDVTLQADWRPFPGTPETPSRKAELSEGEAKDPLLQVSPSSELMRFLKQHNSHWQVYTFVRACLERAVPPGLWGSNHNKCRFYRNVKKFVCLGKFSTFSLQELLWKMRVNDCSWLRLTKGCATFVPASEHRFREVLMSKFLYWVMDSYVRKLLQSFFYITETTFQKNLLFFFRKSIWRQLQSIGVRKHLSQVHLHALSKEEIESMKQEKPTPVAGRLHFIPKQNGLRPVVKMDSVVGAESFSQRNIDRKIYYFNTQFRNLLSVLNYERTKNPALLGSSVFGRNDIHAMWREFVLKVLESNKEMPKFYFVKADVTGAYDTIPHDKLVEVVSRALSPEKNTKYSIRRYAVIMRSKNGQIRKYFRRHTSTYQEYCPDMNQFVWQLQESSSLCNAVVVEQSVSLKECGARLYEFFLQTIYNSILNIENRYYAQCHGIPQGFILSTLLCNLCYGDMENQLLRDIQKDGLLMRLTDDFLLVTPHLTKARAFLRTLAMSIPEYGFVINPEKMVTNFPVDGDIPGCSEFRQLPEQSVIPWCGLLINTQTLEVYCDYSSYACTSIRSSISFNSSNNAGIRMRNKLQTVLQLKCHHLFLDLQINSLKTVCINIFKILLLQAYRFHACILQLPFNQQVKNNPSFFLSIISDSASFCFSTLKSKNSEIYLSTVAPSVPLTSKAVQWIAYHAFSIKLANHSVVYKCLLAPLRRCKNKLHKQIPKTTMKLLKEATELTVYGDFRAILD